MTSAPRVSVILPVYNAAPYLGAALDSVLGQTFEDFELLAHDDGSTDGSLAILQDYAVRDPRIKITSGSNQGIVATLNQLIETAQGDLLARMDADDICLPERFARQVAFLDAHPDVGVLGSFVTCIDSEGRPIRDFTPPLDHDTLDATHLASGGPCLWHPSVMMRKSALMQVEGYQADYPHTEDYNLWLRLGEVTQLANLPQALLRYRLHLKSTSVTRRDIQITSAARALADACHRRGLPAPTAPATAQNAPSHLDILRKWGWWAVAAGNPNTARHYARKALAQAPFQRASWKLLAQALRPRA